MKSPADAAEFLTTYAQSIIKDCLPFNGQVEGSSLSDAIALLECAVLLGENFPPKNFQAPAPSPPDPGQWAKTLQTEHMHRPRGMVFGMTMADLVAFEDSEKARQDAGHVDAHA